MKSSYFICLLVSALVLTISAQAAKKKTKTNFKLIEAYSQKTLGGIPGAPPQTGNHFIIKWEATTYPETFFWRGDNGWLSCKIEKAHKVAKTGKMQPAEDYTTEFVTGDQIHKGDTLELSPVTGGRFPIPAEIPKNAKNTLFYKTGGSKWLAFPVSKIAHKADVPLQ